MKKRENQKAEDMTLSDSHCCLSHISAPESERANGKGEEIKTETNAKEERIQPDV